MKRTARWLLPWPSRSERKAAIRRAEEGTAESRRKAQQARKVSDDLHNILERNHFAQILMEGLMAHHHGKDGP